MRTYIHPSEFFCGQIVWVRLETEFKQPIMIASQVLSLPENREIVEVQCLTDDGCVYVNKNSCYEIRPGI